MAGHFGGLSPWPVEGLCLSESSRGRKSKGKLSVSLFTRALTPSGGPHARASVQLNYFQKAQSPDAVPLGIRAST